MNAESDMSGSEKLLVVRGLRLFRLMRALRMLSHFKIVWRLVYGLLTAVQTIISMTMLIAVSLFIFACVVPGSQVGHIFDLFCTPKFVPLASQYIWCHNVSY